MRRNEVHLKVAPSDVTARAIGTVADALARHFGELAPSEIRDGQLAYRNALLKGEIGNGTYVFECSPLSRRLISAYLETLEIPHVIGSRTPEFDVHCTYYGAPGANREGLFADMRLDYLNYRHLLNRSEFSQAINSNQGVVSAERHELRASYWKGVPENPTQLHSLLVAVAIGDVAETQQALSVLDKNVAFQATEPFEPSEDENVYSAAPQSMCNGGPVPVLGRVLAKLALMTEFSFIDDSSVCRRMVTRHLLQDVPAAVLKNVVMDCVEPGVDTMLLEDAGDFLRDANVDRLVELRSGYTSTSCAQSTIENLFSRSVPGMMQVSPKPNSPI